MHDLIIRGATIYDGSGGPARHGDVAVSGGRIAAIGDGLGAARETVEADGLALAPGIIDTHTHSTRRSPGNPWATPSPGLGVTTVVIGNCGFAIAPCRPRHRDMTRAQPLQRRRHVHRRACAPACAGTSRPSLNISTPWKAPESAPTSPPMSAIRRAHMGDGGGRDRTRRHRRRSDGNGRHRARGHGGRGDRLRHFHLRGA